MSAARSRKGRPPRTELNLRPDVVAIIDAAELPHTVRARNALERGLRQYHGLIASCAAIVRRLPAADPLVSEHLLRLASHAGYSWMPKIMPSYCEDNWQAGDGANPTVLQRIMAVESKEDAIAFLETMQSKAPVANSWIATSKTLHFLKPDVFPIWDTKIADHFDEVGSGLGSRHESDHHVPLVRTKHDHPSSSCPTGIAVHAQTHCL